MIIMRSLIIQYQLDITWLLVDIGYIQYQQSYITLFLVDIGYYTNTTHLHNIIVTKYLFSRLVDKQYIVDQHLFNVFTVDVIRV